MPASLRKSCNGPEGTSLLAEDFRSSGSLAPGNVPVGRTAKGVLAGSGETSTQMIDHIGENIVTLSTGGSAYSLHY